MPEHLQSHKWQKGIPSPNPNGRPKGSKNRSTIASKWLETCQTLKNPITGENETLTQEDLITLALIHKARKGDVQAYKQLMDSVYGMPKQQTDITTTQETPIFVTLDIDGKTKPLNLDIE